jgi:hypothetical protein
MLITGVTRLSEFRDLFVIPRKGNVINWSYAEGKNSASNAQLVVEEEDMMAPYFPSGIRLISLNE